MTAGDRHEVEATLAKPGGNFAVRSSSTHAAGISVVIPCCNAVRTLGETLIAAIAEVGQHQVIVIDDGSSDNTLALAKEFAPHVRVLTGPNRGVSAARNRGIAETTAKWLLFLDADDLLMPGTVAARLEVARATGADVVVCDWEEIIDDGSGPRPGPKRAVDWPALNEDAELAIATRVWAPTAALLYRRALVERIGGFRADLPVIQDARFLFDAAFCGARLAHAPHVGARYRIAPGSLSRRSPARFWEDVLTNGRQIEALWRARGTFGAARRRAVLDIYNNAARGLFAAGHPAYFSAVEAQRRLGLPLPRHTLVAAPLARAVGLGAARAMLGAVGRA